jgi:nitroimidazol reductase NimA-like FMN-containing flavoprotein (pyridoxamine 5'-phosphate oxidase superfamily)
MNADVISIIESHGIVSLATLRPDGWPQATTVSFVNDGVLLYFLISRSGQKFANLQKDARVSACMASEPKSAGTIRGLSLAGRASESRDEPYRSQMLDRLSRRHPGYFDAASLDMKASALMRLTPKLFSIVDYAQGLGHQDVLTVGADEIVEMTANRPSDWGPNPRTAA